MRDRVIVLKLGGSVLGGEASLPRAVHEIHRFRRDGFAVVAVVSAFAGETDRLLARASGLGAAPASAASAAATGEQLAAALLCASLDRAGVPAIALSPAALALRAEGPPLAATPVAVDRALLDAAFARDEVAVVPGFTGVDARGRTVVLGRGGSDLTALFLASALGARCRLLKDVDGLYEWDPARPRPQPRPRRHAAATWDDALATDGTILQHRAVEFARARQLAFEVAGIGTTEATQVGPGPTRFAEERRPAAPIRVALLGLGTVGSGVWTLARDLPGELEIVAVCARDRGRAQALGVPADRLVDDPLLAAASGADVVVECLGGLEPARSAVARALASGSDVVTANKLLLAEHGAALRELALANGARLRGSAAVGGSMPVLERIAARRRRGGSAVRTVRAVLNGTANFVLEELAGGNDLDAALAAATAAGLAERTTTGHGSRDLDGRDAADKLLVLAAALGAPAPVVERQAWPADAALRVRRAAAAGRRLRQVATLDVDAAAGRTTAGIALEEVGAADPLFDLPGAANAALLGDEAGGVECLFGIGAGRWPTAESVLGDLLALGRARATRVPVTGRLPACAR